MLLTEYNEAEAMELFKEEGREEGRIEGLEKGFTLISALTRKLRELGRPGDAFRAMEDPAYCDRLIAEFGLA